MYLLVLKHTHTSFESLSIPALDLKSYFSLVCLILTHIMQYVVLRGEYLHTYVYVYVRKCSEHCTYE